MGMDMTAARERLYRAEDEFAELMQGSKDLLIQDQTRYVFADGTEVFGVVSAAREAERLVRAVRGTLSQVA